MYFFPGKGRMSKEIRKFTGLCSDCLVKTQCATDALVHDEEGVWGGLTKTERDIMFSQIGVQAVHQAIDQGWFQPERLPEHSAIRAIAKEYRSRKLTPSLPSQPVVVTRVVRSTVVFDFELLDAAPTVAKAVALMVEQLEEAPLPTVVLESSVVDPISSLFDFETPQFCKRPNSTLQRDS